MFSKQAKASCFFNVAMFQYFLPTALLTGKPPLSHEAKAVHKVWPLLLTGIEKLDFKGDTHLTKILSDLIVKWLPHFRIVYYYKLS